MLMNCMIAGVRILENVRVNKVVTDGVTVQSVECSKGTINCEIFINCGGLVRA